MAPRVPKVKIIRAHKLADELLAIWQADIRPYMQCAHPDGDEDIDNTTTHLIVACGRMAVIRREVEGET